MPRILNGLNSHSVSLTSEEEQVLAPTRQLVPRCAAAMHGGPILFGPPLHTSICIRIPAVCFGAGQLALTLAALRRHLLDVVPAHPPAAILVAHRGDGLDGRLLVLEGSLVLDDHVLPVRSARQ